MLGGFTIIQIITGLLSYAQSNALMQFGELHKVLSIFTGQNLNINIISQTWKMGIN